MNKDNKQLNNYKQSTVANLTEEAKEEEEEEEEEEEAKEINERREREREREGGLLVYSSLQ